MKKNIFLILITLLFNISFGQTHRFFYNVTFKKDSAGTFIQNDIVVLDINKNNNYFYSYEYLKKDSLNQQKGAKFQFAYPKFKPIVSWDKNIFTFTHNMGADGYRYDNNIEIKWTLTNETKSIEGFSVQKATGTYGGRNWIAWFSTDLPFPYGPYVFYGLPGLILEVYDDKENYHFTFIGNKKLSQNFDSEKFLKPYMSFRISKIKKKDWKQIQLNKYYSPLAIYKTDEAIIIKENGQQQTLKEIIDEEKEIQEEIRKYNNPIELDEIVHFPK